MCPRRDSTSVGNWGWVACGVTDVETVLSRDQWVFGFQNSIVKANSRSIVTFYSALGRTQIKHQNIEFNIAGDYCLWSYILKHLIICEDATMIFMFGIITLVNRSIT